MTDIASALKAEITRLSRKAIRQSLAPVLSGSRAHRKEIAALKQQVAMLDKQIKQLQKGAKTVPVSPAEDGDSSKARFSAKGLRSLRARLDLSAEDFGRLIDASGQSVYKWEAEKAFPRKAQIQKIASVRSIGKREAKARLEGS